jgi:hypothetical protein
MPQQHQRALDHGGREGGGYLEGGLGRYARSIMLLSPLRGKLVRGLRRLPSPPPGGEGMTACSAAQSLPRVSESAPPSASAHHLPSWPRCGSRCLGHDRARGVAETWAMVNGCGQSARCGSRPQASRRAGRRA